MSIRSFSDNLIRWYDENRRVLPWREDPTPYHVWLSEIMLQQTRVEAVKSYYARFLSVLPDIASLAAAEEDVYNKLWEGLGYYSRVRNLHKGACTVMQEYGGTLPSTAEELKKIPGIGPYTSSAIASIAFGEKVPAIDGNLLRIFARLNSYPESIREKEAYQKAHAFYLERMPADRPGDFNQALMDLGSAVCLPNSLPLCESCPLQSECQAHKEEKELSYPYIPPKAERKTEELTVFIIHDGQRIVLHKRSSKGLLAGLYEYPNVSGFLSEKEAIAYLDSIGFPPLHLKALPMAQHVFTHKVWNMQGYEVKADELRLDRIPSQDQTDGLFSAEISDILEKYSIPTAFRKVGTLQ